MSSDRIFVGREEELKAFREVLCAPQGQAVLITGPQGMGKSLLANKMADSATKHPDLLCDYVRFEVTGTDAPDKIMEHMVDRAFDAAGITEGSFEKTERGARQRLALFKLVPKVSEIAELVRSLRRDEKKNARDQLLEKLNLISKRMADNARAIFVIDSEKYMADGSADAWRLVVENLPDKIKFLFAQRPDDVLAASDEFAALAVRIPQESLSTLEERAVEDLIQARAPELKQPISEVRSAVKRYRGHPYAVAGALDLLADDQDITDLPADPTPEGIAESQYRRVCGEHGENAIKLFEAYAMLEVAVPDDIVQPVSGLSPTAQKALLANRFIAGLLWNEPDETRRIYHSLLADHVHGQISPDHRGDYHRRAVDAYRKRLKADVRPDALGATRLPEHILATEGSEAFLMAVTNDCMPALLTLGLLGTAEALSKRSLELADEGSQAKAAISGNLGLIYQTRGDLDKAEQMQRKALEIDQKLGWLEGMASQYCNLGLIYQTRGDLDKAEQMVRKSLEICEKLGLLEGVSRQYGNLGVIYQTRGDLDKSEKLHRKALEIEEKLGRLEGMANQCGNLGVIYRKRGDLDKAEQMHRKGLEIEQKLGRLEGMANAHGNLGLIYQRRGDLDKAEQMHRKALEIDEKLGSLEGMAANYGALGLIYQTRGELGKAEEMHRKALEMSEKLGSLEGMASSYGNIGTIFGRRGDLDKAENLHRKSLEMNEKLGRLEGMAADYGNLGLIYQTRGNLDKAEQMHRKSLEIEKKLGRLEGMAREYANLGLIYRTRGELDKAEQMHRKSLEINEKLGQLEGMASDYGNLGMVYRTRGDVATARSLWTKARDLFEQIGIPHKVEKVQRLLDELPPDTPDNAVSAPRRPDFPA